MFPAYSSGAQNSQRSNQINKAKADSCNKANEEDWLHNSSFSKTGLIEKGEKEKTDSKEIVVVESSDSLQSSSDDGTSSLSGEDQETVEKSHKKDRKKAKEKKKKKKEKKKKKKEKRKRKSKHDDSSMQTELKRKKIVDESFYDFELFYFSSNEFLQKLLCDKEYLSYFSTLSNDQLKSSNFIEELPGIVLRNAFRINKKGDKNNICFDSAYFKQVPKYNLPKDSFSVQFSRKLKILNKKKRREIIRESKRNRYFLQLDKIRASHEEAYKQPSAKLDLTQSTLSNKLWLYLEMKRELDEGDHFDEQLIRDKATDYMKYLNENKNDVRKWLEFIEFQKTHRHLDENIESPSIITSSFPIYERILAIYERAIKENPNDFRLRIEKIKYQADSIEMNTAFDSAEQIEKEFMSLLIKQSTLDKSQLNKTSSAEQIGIVQNLFEVWFEYLSFLINNNFSYNICSKIKRTFQKAFEFFLNNDENMLIKRHANSAIVQVNLLEMFETYCLYMCKNGYVEKAIGSYQALIDFNFGSQNSDQSTNINDLRSKRSLFELFWDIGLPKFGEKFSSGWSSCLKNRNNLFATLENDHEYLQNRVEMELETIEERILLWNEMRIEHRWHEIERLRSIVYWYPFYPRTVTGESADDCSDPDRLISFEDDVSFLLFNLCSPANAKETNECLKFHLLSKFFKLLNLVRSDEECLDGHLPIKVRLTLKENVDFVRYLNEQFTDLNDYQANRQDLPFTGTSEFLSNMLICFYDVFDQNSNTSQNYSQEDRKKLESVFKRLIKSTIDFFRACLQQASDSFETLTYKTNLTILKWKFELNLYYLLRKLNKQEIRSENEFDSYLNAELVKQNLLNQAKNDLSSEENRSNFTLWKQYGILKWILNNFDTEITKAIQLKETRKVFDTLLNTSAHSVSSSVESCILIYSLCVDYVQIELDMFYNKCDFYTSSLSEGLTETQFMLSTQFSKTNFFNLDRQFKKSSYKISLGTLKQTLSELMVKNCLNKDLTSQKKQTTFKIEMSGSTKLLLNKRDFQSTYERYVNECHTKQSKQEPESFLKQKKFFLFHQVYSLFLLCINDVDKLFELNDSLLKNPISYVYFSKLSEFYLILLNYLYYREARLTRFKYKIKLYEIIRAIIVSNKLQANISESFLDLLQLTLIQFKVNNSNLFCNQLLENKDIDLMLTKIGTILSLFNKSASSSFYLSLIHTNLNRFKKIHSLAETESVGTHGSSGTLEVKNFGLHHEIRRQFERAAKCNPNSLLLWLNYFQFETYLFEKNNHSKEFKNKILYIYYQSIRNLPYSKVSVFDVFFLLMILFYYKFFLFLPFFFISRLYT
jgi:hypothetical protein